jgi:hypothetical protein
VTVILDDLATARYPALADDIFITNAQPPGLTASVAYWSMNATSTITATPSGTGGFAIAGVSLR